MTDDSIMEKIAMQMDSEAEKLRVFRDAARRRGETDAAAGLGDRAAGFARAAKLIRESSNDTAEPGLYLVWSHEHGAWWGVPSGYTTKLSRARRFSREAALKICTEAMPGTASRLGVLPELPVPLTDLNVLIGAHQTQFPDFPTTWL